MKMARCIKELERIYGVRQGSAGNAQPNNSDGITTQKQLASQIGVNQDTLLNYKKLNKLIPELQSLVENDALKATYRTILHSVVRCGEHLKSRNLFLRNTCKVACSKV
jgi:hypothetical protein